MRRVPASLTATAELTGRVRFRSFRGAKSVDVPPSATVVQGRPGVRACTNVLAAIRAGLMTPATKMLLEECERRVAEPETALVEPEVMPRLDVLPERVERYLRDLRRTLKTDTAAARRLLSPLLEPIRLRPVGRHLVGQIRGNLAVLLAEDGMVPILGHPWCKHGSCVRYARNRSPARYFSPLSTATVAMV